MVATEILLFTWIIINARYGSVRCFCFWNRLSEQHVCVFSVDKLITDHSYASYMYLLVFFFCFVLFFFCNKACLVESIYQRPRINTIALSDQFRRLQISAELLNAVITHDYASLFASIRAIRTIRTIRAVLYSLFATVCHYTHYSYYFLFAFGDDSLFGVFQAALNILCKQIHNNQNLPQSTTNLINLPLKKEKTSLILS